MARLCPALILMAALRLAGQDLQVLSAEPEQIYPRLLVVDTGARCRERPDVSLPVSRRVPLGAEVWAKTTVSSVTWYWVNFDGKACFVSEMATSPIPQQERASVQRTSVLVLERVLSRKDATVADYAEVETFLMEIASDWRSPETRLSAMPGLEQFRYLQIVDRVLANDDFNTSFRSDPMVRYWFDSHRKLLEYFEPDGEFLVPDDAYWRIFDENQDQPWAEELMWYASGRPVHIEECFSSCQFDLIMRRQAQYWTHFPAGPHVDESLTTATKPIRELVDDACTPDPTSIDHKAVAAMLDGLAKVTSPVKRDLLQSLDEMARKCPK